MRVFHILLPATLALAASAAGQSVSISGGKGQGTAAAGKPAPQLKTRTTRSGAATPRKNVDFCACVYRAVRNMPAGGGYAARDSTIRNLSENAVVWDDAQQKLRVDIQRATPSFCSSACYVALLYALQVWQVNTGLKLPPAAWAAMDITRQRDGIGIWGRANANGPGFAKLVHDLRAGASFTDIRRAKPGDFLKFFWSEEIGCRERGHLVVFLGTEEKDGATHVRYWSSNTPDGYSIRSTPLSQMHHPIFTRITRPDQFANAARLPEADPWLQDMQTRSFTFAEVCSACGIITAPAAAKSPAAAPAR